MACDTSQADWACCSAPLFDEARAQGCDPQYLVAHFLVSADCAGTRKEDVYKRQVYANINRLLRERRGDRMDMTVRPHKGDYFVWYRWS